MKKLISIIIPAYNEEESIPRLFKNLKKVFNANNNYTFEVIVVENGSDDNTILKLLAERRKDRRIKIMQLAKNATCDGGILAGLGYAKGQAAVIMMADLQDPPELIPRFLDKWNKGFLVVNGVVKKRLKVGLIRRLNTFIFYKIMNLLTSGSLPENVSDFRLLDKKVYKILITMPERDIFFRGMVNSLGFKQVGISFDRPGRFAGNSKADFKTALNVAMNGVITLSTAPIRLIWILAFLWLLITIYYLFADLDFGLVLTGILFIIIILGILGEYTLRLYSETRKRPRFIIKERHGL